MRFYPLFIITFTLITACGGGSTKSEVDSDKDGVINSLDAFPFDNSESEDTDSDGIGNNADAFPDNGLESNDNDKDGIGDNTDTDDDNDGISDETDTFPTNPSESADNDSDGLGNNADSDDDNDGVLDTNDAFPNNASESIDTDNDGTGNNADVDDDNDGVSDINDAFPNNALESIDTDNDGTGNNADLDDDNDGISDTNDAFPINASESIDTDRDGIGNNADLDDDNDVVPDTSDTSSNNDSESIDTDNDGTDNTADLDDDNDGVSDTTDAFPTNPSESADNDSDGIGNNTDNDDDNDGVLDSNDTFPNNNSEFKDSDSDGVGDNEDLDDDNDGVPDTNDAFPINDSESKDADSDGVGDNGDFDDDNDGIPDTNDAFPNNDSESKDSDSDGVGDNEDLDDDNDGVPDTNDVFPENALESKDSDSDGVGDSKDLDDDNDGVPDTNDAFPINDSESKDTDSDGVGDNEDLDDDNDGVPDTNDAFPINDSESKDYDSDGVGNNGDLDDDNDGYLDEHEVAGGSDPLDYNSRPLDTDYDGQADIIDDDDDGDGYTDIIEIAEGSDPILYYSTPKDSDYDKIPDSTDTDDDNDGFSDEIELLVGTDPLNSYSKPSDVDDDGIPDLTDTDNDNDGIDDDLDAFPFNAACSVHETGQQCYLEDAVSASKMEIDSNGIVYFLIEDQNKIYRWDSNSKKFLLPSQTGAITPSDSKLTIMTYSETQNRLYLGYDSGIITYIDTKTGVENRFYTLPLAVQGLAPAGNYVLAQDASGAWNTHYIFDSNGTLTDSAEWNRYSRVYKWNSQQNRVYFFRDQTSPNDLHYEEIDQNSGTIISKGESPYHGSYNISPPIVIDGSGSKILIGSGSIFNSFDLSWAGAIPADIQDAIWLDSESLITLRPSNDQTMTIVERRNDDLGIIERVTFAGLPRRIIAISDGYVVITEENNSLQLITYKPSDDSDDDGVLNTNDHFPLDVAASLDSDNDGYPNSWNTGKSESDSTTGLIIDSYPQNSACYLLEHGDGVTCDVSSTIPNYTPDNSVMGADGTIYLFSKDNNKVFRWSTLDTDDLSPIYVGSDSALNSFSPTIMTYSKTHNRLYFGYETGRVSFVDLSDISYKEQEFTYVSEAVGGLGDAGNHLLVQDNSGAWNTHYIYDINGVLKDSAEWNYYSEVYAWNSNLNRVYFFAYGSTLKYEEIDSAGTILSSVETPYDENYYSNNKSIIISPDKNQVLISSGSVYDATNFSWNGTLANNFVSGIWATDNEILTLREVVSGQTRLDQYDKNQNWLKEQDFLGSPIAIFEYLSKIYVVTKDFDGVLINEYTD